MKVALYWFYFIGFVLLLTGCVQERAALPQPQSISGLLDYSQHDFTVKQKVSLAGNWSFYWKQLLRPEQIRTNAYSAQDIEVPHNWMELKDGNGKSLPSFGYATYHTRIRIPSNAPALALNIPFIPTASAIYINDSLIIKRGEVGRDKASNQFNILPIYQTLPDVGSSFSLTIQVSNFDFHAGGILHNFYLGTAEEIINNRKQEIIFGFLLSGGLLFLGIFLILANAIGILSGGFTHLGFCFLTFGYWNSSAWSKLFNEFIPSYDWGCSIRIEFFMVFGFIIALLNFSRALYPEESNIKFVRGVQIIETLLGLSIFLIPLHMAFAIIEWHLYIIGIVFLYLSVVVIRAILNRRKDVIFAVWGLSFGLLNFFLYIFHDLNVSSLNQSANFLLNAVLFILLLGVVLYRQLTTFQNLSKRAEAGIQAKSQFLSVISHEMRTPMNGILGMTELLNTTSLTVEQKDYVKSIKASGQSLITLIDDILDLTRIQEGKLKVETTVFDSYALFEETRKLFQQRATNKGIDLRIHIATDVPQYLLGSPIRIRQVIDNLVNNALKFTEQGFIKIHVYTSRSQDDILQLYCAIEDSGIGISANKQQDIFKRFSQVDSTISRKHNGVGLGLSICKRLVQAMHGDITVESKLGTGSTFQFFVEVQKGKRPQNNLNDNLITQTNTPSALRILVAEDNKVNLKLLLMGLKKLGYAADSVMDGHQAVIATRKRAYDLIFMDIQMPILDGLEATRQIMKEKSIAEQPYIVALTANAFPEDKIAAFEAGVHDYLVKPVQLATIKSLLQKMEMSTTASSH